MLVKAGNRIAAIALLWSAIAIEPLDLGAHRRLAAMLANAGDPDGAANEYARYIDFVLPTGDVGRAAAELSYGATMLGGHPALHEAAEQIALAFRRTGSRRKSATNGSRRRSPTPAAAWAAGPRGPRSPRGRTPRPRRAPRRRARR